MNYSGIARGILLLYIIIYLEIIGCVIAPQTFKVVIGAVLLIFNICVCIFFIWTYAKERIIGFIW